MALLIVDDEQSTRDSLRLALTELGHKIILEARNGEEALKIIDTEKTRLQLIIADLEMPRLDGLTLADRIGELADLDMVPFLLITSDLPPNGLVQIQEKHRRIDHAIVKPFRVKVLNAAIQQAFARRVSRRDVLLWLSSAAPPERLLEVLALKKNNFIFKRVSTDLTCKEFGAVLMDLRDPKINLQPIQFLRKSVLGSTVSWVCLSRSPQVIFPVRTLCSQFVNFESHDDVNAWTALLEQLNRRLIHGWEIDATSQEVKPLIQQKKLREAKKGLERLLVLDPMNANSHISLADLLFEEKELEKAIQHEFRALEINPCLPKPYIKLLEVLTKADLTKVSEVSASAKNYCPQNTDVLLAAATALEACAHYEEARGMTEYLLTLNPKLEGANLLAEKLAQSAGDPSRQQLGGVRK